MLSAQAVVEAVGIEPSVGSVGDSCDPLELEARYYEHQPSPVMVAGLM